MLNTTPGAGVKYGFWSRKNALADVRRAKQLHLHATAGGVGFPARHCFRQLRPLRSIKCDRYYHHSPVRARGFGRDLLDRGDVYAFQRTDSDLQLLRCATP